ncbi:MAG: M23 family metallopeptidase [Subdoligranulum variabile]|uniref:M23 family metallopeptidase n=1 Tax=Subdoligranulum variabile TaxID=214851 RepID=A0A943DCL2_9FIRM|nr:M23 family metallopeptidase [Subdoligranulum variabile]
MRAKSQGEHTADQRQQSPEEYAQGEVQQGVSGAVDRANGTAQRTARMSYRKFRALQEKRKTLAVQSSTATAPKPPEKEKVTVPTQAERRELFKKQRFRQKAVAAKKPAPQAPAPPADVPAPTPPPYRAQMQRLKRRHLTREVVRRYLQRQTATTAAASTAPLVTQAPKLPTISHKQATVDAISRGVHYIAAKIKALLSQTVRRAAQSLLALLGAGCVVLVLAMVIGAAAAVIGSPMGILFANESNDNDSIPIAEIVAETNANFGAAINDIVSAHPECSETTIAYDYEGGHTWASYWPEVLAVFAVHTNLNADSDVVVINAAQKQRIQDTFWAMHTITYEVEEVDVTPDPTEDDPDPEQQTEYILHLTVSSKTVDELAELYNFTQDQKDILHELLSDEMRPTLLALCGGSIGIIEDGELCWPLPGHTYISCNFGEEDAYGNSGHRGTDIPAPEGTPILAAHGGTVIISGWNNSYGNQVLLDNGAGLSTRYAHMTAAAVSAGETVTAGQVIGYVGNTGDSTGFHLHFEVMQNGVRVNPLDAVTPQ